jgi:putative MATE family efflux protein
VIPERPAQRFRLHAEDREILSLAVPALGALAAGPLYTLADTAIIGHLGTRPLAALALAGTLLTATIELADFLSYGVTSQMARLQAAGRSRAARAVAPQALWLSIAAGLAAIALLVVLGGPLLAVIGAGAGVHAGAERYLLIVVAGVPGQLVALAGEGCLRGLGDLRGPLRILVIANVVNVVLEIVFVYVLHMGLSGSALGTLIAQLGMGAAFARRMLALSAGAGGRAPRWRAMRPMLHTGGHLTIRTGALLGAFTLASALAARLGAASLAAHQVAFELFLFLALVLDAIAIAGQIMIARRLGAADVEGARGAARRMVAWAVAIGAVFGIVLAALSGIGPQAFGGGAAAIALGHPVWRLLALMQPVAAAVFALDGILIGAGDTRYLAWAMVLALAGYLPLALVAGNLTGLWWALVGLLGLRLLTLVPRFLRGAWLVVGESVR